MSRKVLHVIDNLQGGLGSFLTRLAPMQVLEGHDVTVAAPAPLPALPGPHACHRRWEAGPRPNHRLPLELLTLERILREVRPEVIHLHNDKAGFVGRLLVRGRLPTVYQPHAWSFQAAPPWLQPLTAGWERRAARWTDAVVCVSEGERQLGRSAGVHADYLLARNGIDLKSFAAADAEDRAAARQGLGLHTDRPLAVCIGRLHRQKDQHALLDAWLMVRAHLPEAQLILVGDGPDGPGLERRAVPGVSLVGLVADVRPWLVAADVIVQPSRWEGLSLSVLEALAVGRSVVVTDIPGMRELVSREVGARVPPHDTSALVAALTRRLADPHFADGEGRAGRALVERRHDIYDQQRAISELYDDLVAGRRRSQA